MIIHILLSIVIVILNTITSWLPVVTELPFGLDSILQTAVSYFHGAGQTLPYLEVVWSAFLYVAGFELLLLVLKIFLGSRTPHSN